MAEHEIQMSSDHDEARAFARAGTNIHYWAAGPGDAPTVVLTHGVTLDHGTRPLSKVDFIAVTEAAVEGLLDLPPLEATVRWPWSRG